MGKENKSVYLTNYIMHQRIPASRAKAQNEIEARLRRLETNVNETFPILLPGEEELVTDVSPFISSSNAISHIHDHIHNRGAASNVKL